MSKITKELWDTELSWLPMPEGATYKDFYTLVNDKVSYEINRDQETFIDQLKRTAAQRPHLKEAIKEYIDKYESAH